MKRFSIIAATAALTAAGSAYAYTGVPATMIADVENILAETGLAGDVDLTTLSDEQIIEIYAAGNLEGDQIDAVKEALNGEGYGADVTTRRVILTEADAATGLMPAGENSVVVSVQNWMDIQGIEGDASTFTDAQVAEIYFLAFGSDMNDNTVKSQVETIING